MDETFERSQARAPGVPERPEGNRYLTDPGLLSDLKDIGHKGFAGAVGGFVCGLLIGGVGGRLAMFVLRLTSGPRVIGLESDDGFTMGSFTGSTIFLLGAAAAMGLFGGVVYVLVRGWLPEKKRPLLAAAAYSSIASSAIVNPDGVDFTLVGPPALAIGLFILLPALYGYATALLVERLLAMKPGRIFPWLGLGVVLLPIMFLGTGAGGLGGILVVGLLAASLIARRIPLMRRIPSLAAVTWAGRAVLALGTAAASVFLIIDIAKIL